MKPTCGLEHGARRGMAGDGDPARCQAGAAEKLHQRRPEEAAGTRFIAAQAIELEILGGDGWRPVRAASSRSMGVK